MRVSGRGADENESVAHRAPTADDLFGGLRRIGPSAPPVSAFVPLTRHRLVIHRFDLGSEWWERRARVERSDPRHGDRPRSDSNSRVHKAVADGEIAAHAINFDGDDLFNQTLIANFDMYESAPFDRGQLVQSLLMRFAVNKRNAAEALFVH